MDDPIVADLGIEEAYFAGITRVDYSDDDICERLTLAMINEAAHLLQEGLVSSAIEIDQISVFGYGFPQSRGGLIHYADSIGAEAIVAKLEHLMKEDAVAWKMSSLLLHCAEKNMAISDAV